MNDCRFLRINLLLIAFSLFLLSCSKDSDTPEPQPKPENTPLIAQSVNVDGKENGVNYQNVAEKPQITISFNIPADESSAPQAIALKDKNSTKMAINITYKNNDSIIIIQPVSPLQQLSKYTLTVSTDLKSKAGTKLVSNLTINLSTALDSTDKFPIITDDELLTLVQRQTFKYFWDFGHPTSGMARERNSSGDIVTTGGTGFGVMAMIVAADRGFVTKTDALQRIQKIVSFLKNNCENYHGAFAHWVNGQTGTTVAFSPKDNGADLVETSLLMQGLLTARQYFNGAGSSEKQLRDDINLLWQNVDWNWFRKDNEDVLYWHWSRNYSWDMNMKIQGWNECLITYVLAASSPSNSISKTVYDNGWARNGSMRNGNKYYGIELPLGSPYGGPLFFAHYSFLGLNPNKLSDTYADYRTQVVNHTKINRNYCIENPLNKLGYSGDCWGLTASDIPGGYTASSPTNDVGVIAPTAAISSLPYTPEESMKAIRFFYYKLGNKTWGDYGFMDSFSLDSNWSSGSFLAIDQGPQIIMIENYRTGLIWNLFMSCPEIQTGLTKLGIDH